MTADTEAGFLSSLRTVEDHAFAVSHGVDSHWFAFLRPAWEFVTRYVADHRELPPPELVQRACVEFLPAAAPGAVSYTFDLLRRDYASLVLQSTLLAVAESGRMYSEPLEAAQEIVDTLTRLEALKTTNIGHFDAGFQERFEAVKLRGERTRETGFSGIPTGIEVLDKTLRGWQEGEMAAFIARPGVGKTEFLLRSAAEAWRFGYRVVFVSSEMTREQISLRLDPIISHLWGWTGVAPNNDQLMTGVMPPETLEVYRQLGDVLAQSQRFTIVDQSGADRTLTATQIRGIATQYRADILFVDGFKNLTAEVGGNQWDQAMSIFTNLYGFAQTAGIPVLVAEHATRDKSPFEIPELSDVYNGDRIGQLCERVIGLAFHRRDPNLRFLAVPKFRFWKPINARKQVACNVNTGDVGRWVDDDATKQASELSAFLPVVSGGTGEFDAYAEPIEATAVPLPEGPPA